MREHLGFLKTSSAAVKVAAWIFLFLGLIGGVSIILELVPGYSRWVGIVALVLYTFFFFLFTLLLKSQIY
jgi:ABC-type multidrug transport system permease subunit